MRIRVILHSTFRQKIPPENKGVIELDFPEGAVIADMRQKLELPEQAAIAVNGLVERNNKFELHDGDEVRVFRPSAGG
jgi:sulfur carrier protein ThiS